MAMRGVGRLVGASWARLGDKASSLNASQRVARAAFAAEAAAAPSHGVVSQASTAAVSGDGAWARWLQS